MGLYRNNVCLGMKLRLADTSLNTLPDGVMYSLKPLWISQSSTLVLPHLILLHCWSLHCPGSLLLKGISTCPS
uniref:Uncharacterized protein n=1 Tax=Setaria italica TaxID=4555 RepID=K4AKL1_SETIT